MEEILYQLTCSSSHFLGILSYTSDAVHDFFHQQKAVKHLFHPSDTRRAWPAVGAAGSQMEPIGGQQKAKRKTTKLKIVWNVKAEKNAKYCVFLHMESWKTRACHTR